MRGSVETVEVSGGLCDTFLGGAITAPAVSVLRFRVRARVDT